ncbi:putative LPS assembly protein LptD [Cytophagaceae bacterium ABcell3]|nr:putative LPS assembly protein LptD [Cytophagaceae bacterium ABcell3]
MPILGLTLTCSYAQVPDGDTIPNTEIPNIVSPEPGLEEPTEPTDTLPVRDTLTVPPQQEGDIETTILYHARDSIMLDVVTMTVFLYGEASIQYGNITMEAEYIEIDYENNTVYATGIIDTAGKYIGIPVFRDQDDMYNADSIRYNFQTQKGIIHGMVTEQGEGYLHGERIKRSAQGNLYINHGKYTTCNLAHPHFYIDAHRLKVIPEDKIISGPFNVVIGDIPTPIGFFLGYFPVPKTRRSGIIFPAFGEDASFGFNLREGGFYWAIADYVGVTFTGDIFSNGSWRGHVGADYVKRYSFAGNFHFNYSRLHEGFDDDPDIARDYNFTWSHKSQSQGTSQFSASVNFGSSNYFRRNVMDPMAAQMGTLNSTITYFKTFANTPFTLGVSLRQDQNTVNNVATFVLPSVNLGMSRVYPFKGAVARGRWYEQIFTDYQMNTQFQTNNRVGAAADTGFVLTFDNIPDLLDRGQYGMTHAANVGTTIKPRRTFLQFFNINPSFNFTDYWYPERLEFGEFDEDLNQFQRDTVSGFFRSSEYSMNANLTTKINGFYEFRSRTFQAMRHVIIPTLTYQYMPDFGVQGTSHQLVERNGNGHTEYVNRYTGFVMGAPSRGLRNALSFNITNTLEAKVRTQDTTNPIQKIPILDNLSITGDYNFAADSLNLSMININGRTRLLNRIDINFLAQLDPYIYVGNTRVNRLAIREGRGIGQIVTSNISIGTSLNPRARQRPQPPPNATPEQMAHITGNSAMYVDFNIPWNLNVAYNYSFSQFHEYQRTPTANSITFNGDLNLTENWKVRVMTGYDLLNGQITMTNVTVDRDLHCWQMSFTVIPFGFRRSYHFTLVAKASILQDLKLNKRSPGAFGAMH